MYFWNKNKITNKISVKTIFAGLIGLLVVLFVFSRKGDYVKLFLGRLSIQKILQDRHVILLEDAFHIWFGSFKNLILGIGFGSSINITDMKAGAAPYFFNFFATTIVERGILGLILSFLVIYISINSYKKYKKVKIILSGHYLVQL